MPRGRKPVTEPQTPLARYIEAKRLSLGLSYRALAARTAAFTPSVGAATVQGIIRGATPAADTLRSLASALNEDYAVLAHLAGYTDEPLPSDLPADIAGVVRALAAIPPQQRDPIIALIRQAVQIHRDAAHPPASGPSTAPA